MSMDPPVRVSVGTEDSGGCRRVCGGVSILGVLIGTWAFLTSQVFLLPDEYAIMTGAVSKYSMQGPGIIRFNPFKYSASAHKAVVLSKLEYVRVTHTLSGVLTTAAGPQLFFPDAWDSVSHKYEAVRADADTAVLVLDKESGVQRLVTTIGPFFPGPYEQVIETRSRIRVAPHQVAVTRGLDGSYTFYNGSSSGQGTSFFLEPHKELVTMKWSLDHSGTMNVDKIDRRAQYGAFSCTVRTSDNVELVLEGTIFWQVIDVPTMVQHTGDPKGDVWRHARSALIQAIGGVTLEHFMAGFNELVSAAAGADLSFYSQRGVRLHSLEVLSYSCKDEAQARVLQEIIQETTNRINALQKKRSENDVAAEKLRADLVLEQSRRDLVKAQTDNAREKVLAEQQATNEVMLSMVAAEVKIEESRRTLLAIKTENDKRNATAAGEAEGLRRALSVAAFLDKLNVSVPDAQTRLDSYKFLSSQEASTLALGTATKNLGSGSANLFVTPNDLNLRLQVPVAADGAATAASAVSFGE